MGDVTPAKASMNDATDEASEVAEDGGPSSSRPTPSPAATVAAAAALPSSIVTCCFKSAARRDSSASICERRRACSVWSGLGCTAAPAAAMRRQSSVRSRDLSWR